MRHAAIRYSITSSAVASNVGGTSRPTALAVLKADENKQSKVGKIAATAEIPATASVAICPHAVEFNGFATRLPTTTAKDPAP
jgi:hypothetical protein